MFRYFEENKTDANGESYIYSYAVADTVKNSNYQKIRVFSDSRDYKTAHPDMSEADAIANGYATASGSVDNGVVFPGFGADTKVKVRMYVDSFYNNATSAQIMFFNVAGQDTFNRVNIQTEYDGVKGLDYVMPNFEYVERSTVVSGGKYSEKYVTETKSATDCGENLFAMKITANADGTETKTDVTVADGKFAASEAGTYGIVYKYGGYQQAERIIVYETLAAPELTDIVKPASTAITYVTDYEISATAKSAIYRAGAILPDIKVRFLKHDGGDYGIVLNDSLNIGDVVNLKRSGYGLGKYRIEYSFTDALGRKAVENVDFDYNDANRNYAYLVNGTEGEKEPYYYGLGGDVTISASDAYCYDVIEGEGFDAPAVKITDGAGNDYVIGGELSFARFLADRKAAGKAIFGDYTVTYSYTGGLMEKDLVRTISVIDCVAPVLVPATESYVYGAKVDREKTVTKDTVYLNAIKGSELTFENIVAYDNVGEKYDLTDDINLTVYKPDGNKDESVNYDPLNFKYTVNAAGEYIFRFAVADSVTFADGSINKNLEAVIVYVIDVSDNFYVVKLLSDYGVKDTATSFTVSDFTVTDYYGTPVNAVKTVKAFDENGDEVWSANVGEVKKFEKAGVYTVKHVATVNGVTAGEVDVKAEIADKTNPVIVINGDIYKKTIVGREISLVEASATDNEGVKTVVTDVTLDGNIINAYNGKFTPITAGEYKVKVTATDINDNVSVYEYVIIVEKDKAGGFANFANRFGLVFAIVFGVLAAAGAAAFVVLNKNKLVKKQDKGE